MSNRFLKHKIFFFYLFTFSISWISWFIMSLIYDEGDPTLIVYVFSTLGGLGPLFSLLILERVTRNEVSVKQILSQIRIRRAWSNWFLPAIFALPIITLLGTVGNYFIGNEGSLRLIIPGPDELGLMVVPIMVIHFTASLITSPLFEEPGWRGFALVELQRKYGRELGSLIVALLWWLWHQPMNMTFGKMPGLYSAIFMVTLSFMIDSLYNLSGKKLFTAMLAHQSLGTVISFLYQGAENFLQLGLLICFVIFLRIKENFQPVSLSPA